MCTSSFEVDEFSALEDDMLPDRSKIHRFFGPRRDRQGLFR